jgi:hypothetical protein
MYYKDSTEVIIENNLKTALYLFQNVNINLYYRMDMKNVES